MNSHEWYKYQVSWFIFGIVWCKVFLEKNGFLRPPTLQNKQKLVTFDRTMALSRKNGKTVFHMSAGFYGFRCRPRYGKRKFLSDKPANFFFFLNNFHLIIYMIIQLHMVYLHPDDRAIVMEAVSPFLVNCISTIKILNCVFNNDKVVKFYFIIQISLSKKKQWQDGIINI